MLANEVNLWESVKQYKQGLNRSRTCTENKVGLNLETLWLINTEKIPNLQSSGSSLRKYTRLTSLPYFE